MVCDGPERRAAGPRGRGRGLRWRTGNSDGSAADRRLWEPLWADFGTCTCPDGVPTSQGGDRQPVTASLRDTARPGDQKDRPSPR